MSEISPLEKAQIAGAAEAIIEIVKELEGPRNAARALATVYVWLLMEQHDDAPPPPADLDRYLKDWESGVRGRMDMIKANALAVEGSA